jgi:DNA-binding IclR family transcriptional regulator
MSAKKAAARAVNTSALHVFDALRIVASAGEPIGASEIARQLGLPASTVYRSLITLEESEYIDRFQSSARYELGAMPRLLNRALLRRFALQRQSGAALRALAEESGESASVSVRLGWYSLRVAVAYGSHDFYHRDRLGEATPLHASLSSRVILGGLSQPDQQRYWAFAEKHFKPSVSDRQKSDAAIASVRRSALLIEPIAASPERAAVGAALRGGQGEILGSLTLHGPVVKAGAVAAPSALTHAHKAIETAMVGALARAPSPFAHLDPDDIVISLPRNPRIET